MKELLLVLLSIVGLIALILWGVTLLNEQKCYARWESSFQPKFTFLSGCTIVVDGQRIPAGNYRVL